MCQTSEGTTIDPMNERLNDYQEPVIVPEPKKASFWKEIIKFTFITLIIVIPFRIFIAQPFVVSGASMDPTFEDGEYLVVDQLSRRIESPQRESVIIFKYPKDTTKFFIKRVIGLPGETVEISDGKVKIINQEHPDGLILDEPYVAAENQKTDELTEEKLGPNEYFVMGDNRLGSLDSRAWGPVPESFIIGRPLVRLLPIGRMDLLPGDYSQ